jgi:hypothetical protein
MPGRPENLMDHLQSTALELLMEEPEKAKQYLILLGELALNNRKDENES